MRWATPLKDLPWIGSQRARQFERAEILTAADLVFHFPRRWEDRTRFDRFPHGDSDIAVCLCGLIQSTSITRRGRMRMFEAVLVDGTNGALSGQLSLRWFNLFWVEKALAVGQKLIVFGKPKRRGRKVVIDQPDFEVVEEETETSLHFGRITPIHRATEGLSTRVIRGLIWRTLEEIEATDFPNLIPNSLDSTQRSEALKQIHFPDNFAALSKARTHLVLTEFFGIQLSIAARRAEQQAQPGLPHAGPGALMDQLHSSLPFPLTEAQRRSIAEIRADMASDRPMNRLLHGDVGAGKTLVALSAMLLAVEAGFQAGLMAPTQILAEQHYLTFQRLCTPLGIRVALRTGTRREDAGPLPLFDLDQWQAGLLAGRSDRPMAARAAGEPDILIGTHALLYEGAGFSRLGLAVIDEQHKFGVLQRAKLRNQGQHPDMLVMTATPIPRTLTMSLYGDLDVSTLDELPKGRGKIITAVRAAAKLPEAVKFMREHLEAGRQAYVVYPLIDASEKLEAKAAAAEFEKWQTYLAPMPCALLHGRIPAEEKEAIMERFRSGETKALIATTVIEVGIDVPNANMMLIENAERFGLAQLHQLRGRVGRGGHKSYCILLFGSEEPEALAKLQILERTSNGFEIAEADWELRGPGDLLGTAQSGMPPLKIGNLMRDMELMHRARGAAFVLMERDPKLEAPEHRLYRGLLADTRQAVLSQVS